MSDAPDPFSGTWKFCANRSQLSTASPRAWTQRLEVSTDTVAVREDVESANGVRARVEIEAKLDGREYPVSGSPVADHFRYARIGPDTIAATGIRRGVVTVEETIVATPPDQLTLNYSIYLEGHEVARGSAVFERKAAVE